MLDYWLNVYYEYLKMLMFKFGLDFMKFDLKDMLYYQKMIDKKFCDWKEVLVDLKWMFDWLGVFEVEWKYLVGLLVQYEFEVVYYNMCKDFEKLGIIFIDIDMVFYDYLELFKKWFGKFVKLIDNKFVVLNVVVWLGGFFIYVFKGVQMKMLIQLYFWLNVENLGQFEWILIIVEDGVSVDYVEGCMVFNYFLDSLYVVVVEVNVEFNVYCCYIMI